jgi:hypothetical protein
VINHTWTLSYKIEGMMLCIRLLTLHFDLGAFCSKDHSVLVEVHNMQQHIKNTVYYLHPKLLVSTCQCIGELVAHSTESQELPGSMLVKYEMVTNGPGN